MPRLGYKRIHITGASGAGVTTLGRRLAEMYAIPHHDTDDYFWLPTDPPYQTSRPVEDRLRLMKEIFLNRPAWVLSGSLSGWGDPLISYFDTVIFIKTPTEIRLQRLRDREFIRYGEPSPEQVKNTEDFLNWAAAYDEGDESMRSLIRHTKWLSTMEVPVIILDGSEPPEALLDKVSQHMTV